MTAQSQLQPGRYMELTYGEKEAIVVSPWAE